MKRKILRGFGYGLLLLATLACTDDEGTDVGLQGLNLVFEDNFDRIDGNSINEAYWNYEIGTGNNGWGNGELQYYTDRPENILLDTLGNMIITARRESFQGSPFTSARITTKDKIEQQYGRFEARIKLPGGRGIWPAFWMLGSNIETEDDDDPETIQWPFVGEIDILELRGQEPSKVIGSIHGPGYSGGAAISGEYDLDDGRFDADFHVFAIEWSPDFIDYFVDGIRYNRISKDNIPEGSEWVFDDQSFFLLLNVAVGGAFVGFPVDDTPFPQEMIVDYVRIYEITDPI